MVEICGIQDSNAFMDDFLRHGFRDHGSDVIEKSLMVNLLSVSLSSRGRVN